MVQRVKAANRDLFVRRCVECGYDGALLKGGRAERCALCGCDLRVRPARSYAEMEGFVGLPSSPDAVGSTFMIEGAGDGRHVFQRWLTFIFFVLAGFSLLIYLAEAALP